jgi:arylsulfatase A-like enzyme
MDVVPTVLAAVGVDAGQYEIDGTSLLSHVTKNEGLSGQTRKVETRA